MNPATILRTLALLAIAAAEARGVSAQAPVPAKPAAALLRIVAFM